MTQDEAPLAECYHAKFSSSNPQCSNAAVWRSTAPGTSAMTWCADHAPDPEWRVRIAMTKQKRGDDDAGTGNS